MSQTKVYDYIHNFPFDYEPDSEVDLYRGLNFSLFSNRKRSDRSDNLFLIMTQTEFRLAHNQKENCVYDHIPLFGS